VFLAIKIKKLCNVIFSQVGFWYCNLNTWLKGVKEHNPDAWSSFCLSNIVLKTLCDKHPNRVHSLLRSSYFEELYRKGGLGIFFDKSKTIVGRQSFQYRLKHIRLINHHCSDANLWNDSIKILLKEIFFSIHKNQ